MNSCQNAVKDHFFLNFFSQKDKKLHTTGLDDTAILQIKIKLKKYCLKKLNTVKPYAPFNLDVANAGLGTWFLEHSYHIKSSGIHFFNYCFDHLFINLPMQIPILSTSCDVISFLKSQNNQGQLCHLTCARWRDLWNHNIVSTIKLRRQKKKAKKPKPSNIDSKLPMNLVPLYYLPTSPFIWS